MGFGTTDKQAPSVDPSVRHWSVRQKKGVEILFIYLVIFYGFALIFIQKLLFIMLLYLQLEQQSQCISSQSISSIVICPEFRISQNPDGIVPVN